MSKYGLYYIKSQIYDPSSYNSSVYKYDKSNDTFNNIINNSNISHKMINDMILYHDELYLIYNQMYGSNIMKYNDTNKTFEDVPFSESLRKKDEYIKYSCMSVYGDELYVSGSVLSIPRKDVGEYTSYMMRYNKVTHKFD